MSETKHTMVDARFVLRAVNRAGDELIEAAKTDADRAAAFAIRHVAYHLAKMLERLP